MQTHPLSFEHPRSQLPKSKKPAVRPKATGRPVVCTQGAILVLPGFLFGSRAYTPFVETLCSLGYAADVVPMKAQDWGPVLAGSDFQFYLRRVAAGVDSLYANHGPIALVGHSAGGWIARILLGNVPYQGTTYNRHHKVHSLITLGTPHQSIEQYPIFRRVPESLSLPEGAPPDLCGSSLQFTNYFYPRGDCWPGVQVVCLAGNAIDGKNLMGGGRSGGEYAKLEQLQSIIPPSAAAGSQGMQRVKGSGVSRIDSFLAYQSYKSGCGRGDVPGDGVTPIEIAHLPGAICLTLDNVWHGPKSTRERPWYGDEHVLLDNWVQYLDPGYTEEP